MLDGTQKHCKTTVVGLWKATVLVEKIASENMTFNSPILFPIQSQQTQNTYEQTLLKLKLLKWRSCSLRKVQQLSLYQNQVK